MRPLQITAPDPLHATAPDPLQSTLTEWFSPARLTRLAAANGEAFRAAQPFPHAVFDGFLDPALVRAVAKEFAEADYGGGLADISPATVVVACRTLVCSVNFDNWHPMTWSHVELSFV